MMGLVLPEPELLKHAEERGLFYVAIIRAKHQSYILYDTEKPVVFINEVSANQDRKYQFNQISTEGVKSAPPDYATCPSCGSGKVAMRVMGADGRFFFGYRHYPYCDYTPKTCTFATGSR